MPLSKKVEKKVGAGPKRDFHNLNVEHAVNRGLFLKCLLYGISLRLLFLEHGYFFCARFFLDAASSRNPSLLRRVKKIYYDMLEMIC